MAFIHDNEGGELSDQRFGREPEEDEFQADPEVDDAAEEEEDEDLSDLPDDVRARVEKQIARENNAFKAKYGNQVKGHLRKFRQAGLDIGEDDRVFVRNPALAAGLLGTPQVQARQEAAPEREPENEEAAAEWEGDIPDPYADPEEFKRYIQHQATQAVSGATKALTARNAGLERQLSKSAFENAMAAAPEVLEQYGLADLTEHPGFRAAMLETFAKMGVPMESWDDPDILARVAGVANVDLRKAAKAQKSGLDDLLGEDDRAPARKPREEQQDRQTRNRGLGQRALSQVGASRGGDRGPAPSSFTEHETKMARLSGVTPAEFRALKNPELREYHDYQAKARKRR